MTIEMCEGGNSVFYVAKCYTCSDYCEENGDPRDGPLTIVDADKHATFEQAEEEAKKHGARFNDHEIRIGMVGFDID